MSPVRIKNFSPEEFNRSIFAAKEADGKDKPFEKP
jgi:hypothetical protein